MSLTWSEFRKGLMREIADMKSNRAYEKARGVSPELGRFPSPEALTAWLLRHGKVRREEEDAQLRAIIQQYRTDERHRGVWLALLILGLWPSLTWVFQKLWPIAKGVTRRAETANTESEFAGRSVTRDVEASLDEIIAGAIWGALTDVLEDEHICEASGIAKRLMYAVWKQAKVQLLDSETEHERQVRLGETLEHTIPKQKGEFLLGPEDSVPTPFLETSGDQDAKPPDCDLTELAGRLVQDFGLSSSDADLVIRHAVLDQTLADIARERGGSFPALRQRYSRAIRKIRTALQEKRQSGCHTFSLFRLGVMEEESSADEILH